MIKTIIYVHISTHIYILHSHTLMHTYAYIHTYHRIVIMDMLSK